jgi:hypothetical protein
MRASRCIQTAIRQNQPLHRSTTNQVLLDNLVYVGRLHKAVPDLLRIHHHDRPMLALLQATGLVRPYRVFESRRSCFFLKKSMQFPFAIVGAAAARSRRVALVCADENVPFKLRQLPPLPYFPHVRPTSHRPDSAFSTTVSGRRGPHLRQWMFMQPDTLHSLKDDMVAFIEGHGIKRLPGFVTEDVPSVLWEDEENPDSWKDFVEMAKVAAVPFITMSDITLEKGDVEELLEDLRDTPFPDPESSELEEAEYLVNYVGKTGFVQLGFVYQGVMFLHESATEWYERYQHLLDTAGLGGLVVDDGSEEE